MQSLPIINITHQNGSFITKDETTLTYHNHAKYIDYIRVHSWFVYCIHLDKCEITYINHYNIIENTKHVLKFSVLCIFIPPLNS